MVPVSHSRGVWGWGDRSADLGQMWTGRFCQSWADVISPQQSTSLVLMRFVMSHQIHGHIELSAVFVLFACWVRGQPGKIPFGSSKRAVPS